MINSIPTIESKYNNTFGEFTNKKLPSDYWLPADVDKSEKRRDKNKIIIMTPDEARSTNNARLIGLSIAGATVLTAAGLFFILKGGPKGLSRNFQKFRDALERKVQNSKLNNTSHKGLNKVYIFMIRKLDVAQQKFEAVNNFTTLKDLLFKKIMYNDFGLKPLKITGKTNYGQKIHDGITRIFEKLGRQSVLNSYNKTAGKIAERKLLCSSAAKNILSGNTYDIIEINGLRQSKAQWLSQLNDMNAALDNTFDKHFNKNALTFRYLKIKKAAESLKINFDSLKVFLSKDLLSTFMAENVIAKEKASMQKIVKGYRKNLSYSIADLAHDADDKIIKMTQAISYKDIEKIQMLRHLRQDFKALGKSGIGDKDLKFKILNSIESFRKEILDSIRGKSIDENVAKGLLAGVDDLKMSVTQFKQGQVEDILDIYRKILNPAEYELVEKAYKNEIKALDKSIHIETEEFVSKIRDLTTGGAPTDILTILGSLATLGYYLGKSDNNEERVSISLKYGIPAIAGIGVTLFCNAKLYAGTKSLLIGSISTVIVNKIGSWADNLLKKYRTSKKDENSKPVVPQIDGQTLDLTSSDRQVVQNNVSIPSKTA